MFLREKIEEWSGGQDWNHQDNLDTFVGLVDKLKDYGLTEDEALEILGTAYGATCDEFGC